MMNSAISDAFLDRVGEAYDRHVWVLPCIKLVSSQPADLSALYYQAILSLGKSSKNYERDAYKL